MLKYSFIADATYNAVETEIGTVQRYPTTKRATSTTTVAI